MSGRILCAIDFTARSELALRRAVTLSRQTGARLIVVHAVDPRQTQRTVRAHANRAYVRLLSMIDKEYGSASAAVDIAVRAGGPLDVIVKVADESSADIVVLAAPRPRKLDAIVGTTAERLLRAIKRPVLIVHRDAQAQYRHVALAIDLSNASLPMIQTAGRLGVLDDAYATVLHATSPPYEGMLRAVGVDEQRVEQYNEGWQDEARSRVQAMLGAAGIEAQRARILVRTAPAAVAIRSVLEQERPELLAIGASRWLMVKRLLLGSVTDSLFRTSMCDVLVIPHQLDAAKLRRSYAQAESFADRAALPQLRLTETAAMTGNRVRNLSS